MEGIITAIINGLTAPLTTPFVRRGEAWFRLRANVTRPIPAVVCPAKKRHECPQYVNFLPASKDLLAREPWLKPQLKDVKIPMEYLSGILRDEQIWQAVDADWYEDRAVLVLGAQKASHRLAVILGVISGGALKKRCCQQATIDDAGGNSDRQDLPSATDDSRVTSRSHHLAESSDESNDRADGAIDTRPMARQDPFGRGTRWQDARGAFGENEPYDGLPVAVSKVVFNLEIELLCQPSLRACLDGRQIRDLGRLMHDTRGSFEIHVVWAPHMHTPRGEVRSHDELPRFVRDWCDSFSLSRILWNADDSVFHRICYGSDDRYRHPVRPAWWDDYGALGRTRSERFRELEQRPLGWEWGLDFVSRSDNRGSGRVMLNRNKQLSPLCQEFIEAWRYLGLHVESADLDFGILWLVADDRCHVHLGHFGEVTDRDLAHYYEKLMESGNVRRFLTFYGWPETKELSDDPQRRYFVWTDRSERWALRNFALHIPWYCTPVYIRGRSPRGFRGLGAHSSPVPFLGL